MKKTRTLILFVLMMMVLAAGCSGTAKKGRAIGSKFNINVYVEDEGGKPIDGVKVQACDDSVCIMGNTDKDGHVGFDMKKNIVDIHILKAPEGYAVDADAVFRTAENGDVTIILK